MKKKNFALSIVPAIMFCIIYLGMSFIAMDINFRAWNQDLRVALVVLMFLSLFVYMAFFSDYKSKDI